MADLSWDAVVLVLEGQARGGVPAGRDGDLTVVHAPRDADAAIVAEVRSRPDDDVTVVTADRGLQVRVEAAGGRTMSPSWLLSHV